MQKEQKISIYLLSWVFFVLSIINVFTAASAFFLQVSFTELFLIIELNKMNKDLNRLLRIIITLKAAMILK